MPRPHRQPGPVPERGTGRGWRHWSHFNVKREEEVHVDTARVEPGQGTIVFEFKLKNK